MFLYSKSFADDVSEKERIKRMNVDYRHNGQLWNYYGKFHRWIQQIDNEFARQKLEWMSQDIEDGFASYYAHFVFLQQHIEQPWINEICLKYYSNDSSKNRRHTELSAIGREYNNELIPRDQYQNIYAPINNSNEEIIKELDLYYYDMRVDALYKELTAEADDPDEKFMIFWEVTKAFELELEQLEEKQWRGIEIDLAGFEPAPHHLPPSSYEDYGRTVLDYESVPDVNFLLYSPEPYIKLGQIYFEGFEYQEQLSDKAFKVFTKPINNDYQWALSLFASGGMIWHSFVPLLMIIPTNQNRPIKPKNVVYQELCLSLSIGGNTEGRALQLKKFNYINRYVNRYIDWIQDKVMAVIESE